MFTRLVVVSLVAVVLSACGGGVGDPSITLDDGDETKLQRVNGLWSLVTPITFRSGAGATDSVTETRVRDVTGGFLTVPIQTFKVPSSMLSGITPTLTIPLNAGGFPQTVTLQLEVKSVNWNGVDATGVAIAMQKYTFVKN